MSSDQSDITNNNESGTTTTTATNSKAFPRNPLDYGSSLFGAGSPSFEPRLSRRYFFSFLAIKLISFRRAREIQQQEGVPANFWSNSMGNSSKSSPNKTPAEPTIPEGNQPLLH
jgi:hypothetical protein